MCFVALLAIAAAATGPARAQQQQAVVLTTITPTSLTTYNETTPGAVNVIFDGRLEYDNTEGWQAEYGNGYQGSVTVTAKPGFSIDSCKFYVGEDSYTVTAAPFAVYPYCEGSMQEVYSQPNAQGIDVGYYGVKRIDVYGSAVPHSIRLAEGTEDAANWSLASGNASVQGTAVLENVLSGSTLTATYNGTQKVKSVKAVKYVLPAATVTTAPTAKTGVKADQNVAIVNAGTATGGTMMYKVTTANTKPTSTEGFSATVPTANTLAAGTFYVWYYVKANDSHTDSEISATGIEVTIAPPPTTLADAFTDDVVVTVKVNTANNNHWYGATGTYTSGTYATTGIGSGSSPSSVSMTKDGSNLVATVTNSYNTYTVTFNTTNNTYVEDATSSGAGLRMTELQSITINGVDITSTLTYAIITVTWNFSEMSGHHDLYQGYTYQGVTLQGDANLDLDNGSLMAMVSDLTFTAPAGKNFKSIVFTATQRADIDGSGWTYGGDIGNFTSTWTGDASSVSFSGMADGITSIVFTIE